MSKKTIIIVGSAALVFLLVIGAGFFILWSKISSITSGEEVAPDVTVQEEENVLGPMLSLETMIVNLADDGGKRYLRVTMALELSGPEAMSSINMRLPQIRDTILMILPTKTYKDVSTTGGKVALRNELMGAVNQLINKGRVSNIYFTEFVVQ
ncbi:flagellar basal body-associated FliL family protein [Desulfosarcina sp. OttesenSCG-928-G10]|nr:flagellar basal body-associated FliL family protein [Desulfosarcina sp. OttesenSCG-928-G10]MDL2321876.1 flagellar basal body-associated FliL family protein [Desulfosarcina sp. OttesenSCG-928-B08]